jgi:hypothetical protein
MLAELHFRVTLWRRAERAEQRFVAAPRGFFFGVLIVCFVGAHGASSMSKPRKPKVCIFCGPGCGRLTKEDVWPTWLRKYVPLDAKNYTALSALVHLTHSDVTREMRDGDPRSRRVKFVCCRCNNEWMSRFQERGKSIVLPLVKGERFILGQDAQRLLAGWIAMSAMTSDFFYPEKQAIPQSHRDWLRTNLKPPPDTWKIWIGKYEREKWLAQWVKNSLPISSEEHIPEVSADGIPRPNTQTTTLVFGQLYVHVFSSVHPKVVAKAWIGGKGIEKLAQIWPVREHFIAWPFSPMSDKDADTISGAIFKNLDELGLRNNS